MILHAVLDNKIDIINDIIVSGRSPRKHGQNIDIWAERWSEKNCVHDPIIYPCKDLNDRMSYFHRNKLIAYELTGANDQMWAFIPKGKYRSGTWNTIKHFADRFYDWNKKLHIYDEYGNIWIFSEYPKWLKNRLYNRKINQFI